MDIDNDKLRQGRVMVVGCGALGNEVLKNLVLMGVCHFTIVDFDYVEKSNLTRSILFRKNDVGKRKVDVAKSRMEELNPEVEVRTIFGDVAYDVGLAVARQMDVIIGCVDSRWARYTIQRLALRAGKTWVDGGIIELEGTARVFKPGKNCYACSLGTNGLEELQKRMPCSGVIRRKELAGHAPTTPVIASIIGAVEAQEAVKEMTGMPTAEKMFYYEGEHLTARIIDHRAWDDDCPLHEEWTPVEKATATGIDSPVRDLLNDTGLQADEIVLNEPFVDYIVDRETGKRTEVMLPAHLVEDFVERHPTLRFKPLGAFHQHEYRTVGKLFPFGDLTLRQLGVPADDIIRIRTDNNIRYIEI